MTPPVVHHDRITAPDEDAPARWILVLHGIYGSGRNWNAVMRRVVQASSGWGAMAVDLRGHGGSADLPPPFTLEACSRDLTRLVEAEGVTAGAILGHSFGGKVALVHARDAGPGLEQVWVVDSNPGTGNPERQGGAPWAMLDLLRRHPGPFPTREAGVEALTSEGLATPVARWMSTNLEGDGSGAYGWRIDPDAMEELLRDFFRTEAWDVVESPPEGVTVHVVKARDSGVLDDPACARVEAAGRETGRVHLHRVDGGHWVNADSPGALVELIAGAL